MSRPPESDGSWLLTLSAAAIGPVVAILYESGSTTLESSGGLGTIAILVLVAGAGLGISLRALARRPRWIALLACLNNGIVFLFYGFLLAFFGLGGSR